MHHKAASRINQQTHFGSFGCPDKNDNNVIWYYLLGLEKKNEFSLKDLSKFKIQGKFGRPLLRNEPEWAVYYRHFFCTNFEKVREQNQVLRRLNHGAQTVNVCR